MKNKEQLNTDWAKVAKPAIAEEVDIVQMCAHDMRHLGVTSIIIESGFTQSEKQVKLNFEEIKRPRSEEEVNGQLGTEEVDDFKYVGMEEL